MSGLHGTILAAHGRHYVVISDAGERLVCFSRGKRSDAACGDRVAIAATGSGQGVIDAILERRNLVHRSDAYRIKMLAANVDQLMVVVAAEPSFSEDLLGRALVTAEVLDIPGHVLLNKIDLPEAAAVARARLEPYAALGYGVHAISVRGAPEQTIATMLPLLRGKTTLLLGQSGMGKSTLLNLLIPDADAATREISQALQAGKHTTTFTRRYDLRDADGSVIGALIDSPGFQEFGLAHLSAGEVERAFPELRPYLGQCRFYNCSHLAEPGCAVRNAVDSGAVSARRYALFTDLTREAGKAVR